MGPCLLLKEVIFARELCVDLGVGPQAPSVIYSDSKSAVDLAFDPVAFKKTKHILRAAEFLRDLVMKGHVVLAHVRGIVMLADLLTKAVSRSVFISLMSLLADFASRNEPCLDDVAHATDA